MTAATALSHPYVDEGRLRYHTCMCQCCPNSADGIRYTTNAEPVCSTPFHYVFEDELNSISRVKGSCLSLLLICTSCYCTFNGAAEYCCKCVCLSVCMTVSESQEPHLQTSPDVWCMLHVPLLGPLLSVLLYVMYTVLLYIMYTVSE